MFRLRTSFVKLPKHKQFEFQPRYYNPQKEEAEQRLKEMEQNGATGEEAASRKATLKNKFKEARRETLASAQADKLKYRLRILVIICILSYLCYYLIA